MRPLDRSHTARKRFGQNFLHDQTVIHNIIDAIQPKSDDRLIEIGPGLGALTYPLLNIVKQLDVIELDRDLAQKLESSKGNKLNLKVHQMDALKFDFKTLVDSSQKLRIVGNLPYNISTPLIFHLLHFAEYIEDMYFMLQKEVVERMTASPNCKAYGRLSIMVQYSCEANYLFSVAPESFKPQPKVQSAMIRLKPHTTNPYPPTSILSLQQITTTAFNQRRKTIQNSLKPFLEIPDFIKLNIDPKKRAEQLTIAEFVEISRYITGKL